MATLTPVKHGWRAQIKKLGIRDSSTFDTKAEAAAWATRREAEIIAGARGVIPDKTFGDLLAEYSRRVSAGKRGARWEQVRLRLIQRDPVARIRLRELSSAHLADWRDRRLTEVSAASVRREMNLLSHALNIAVDEWRWLPASPMRKMRRPPKPAPRYRRVAEAEIEAICHAAGWKTNNDSTLHKDGSPANKQQLHPLTARVAAAFCFAIETGMRGGEVCALRWDQVDLERRFLTVGGGKTAAARRAVPLSPAALGILETLGPADSGAVFGVSDRQRDALFRKLTARALVKDLHFHDSRHEAITRLARKLDVLDLARVVGIADLRILQAVYYNPTAEELAQRLYTACP